MTTSQQFSLPWLGKWKQFLFWYCCLTAIKHRTTRSVLFPNIVWLQGNFMQCREKSIFCMQCICNVHCNYVVAHAYNTVAKIQSSSGWAFWYVLRSLRLAQDFGNVLHWCDHYFFKVIYFDVSTKECVPSFPFFMFMLFFWLAVKNMYHPNLGQGTCLFFKLYVWINQTLWATFELESNSKADWGMSITLFLLYRLTFSVNLLYAKDFVID